MGSTSNEVALFIFALGGQVALERLSLAVLVVSACVGMWYEVGLRGKMRGLKEAGVDTLARLPYLPCGAVDTLAAPSSSGTEHLSSVGLVGSKCAPVRCSGGSSSLVVSAKIIPVLFLRF